MIQLSSLAPSAAGLVGKWEIEGVQLALPGRSQEIIRWTEEFEWVEGKFFLMHRVQGHVGAAELTCTEIITHNEIHSFYNHGRHQVWDHWFDDEGLWMIQGIWRENGSHLVRCTSRFVNPDRRESIWERSIGTERWTLSWHMAAVRVG